VHTVSEVNVSREKLQP